ncbi:MAG: glycosyltransferase family 4 protein, partial [Lachnospiraceae bacterium]
FGTEYPHTLAMTKVCGNKEKLLIGIQGLCFKYADYYMADLPKRIQKRFLLRDFLKQDNLVIQQKKYVLRGKFEIEALQNTGHVTGRTDWDRQAAAEVNPKARYHFMNETLRSNFYGPRWSIDTCERHSIFLSQGNYPIKGLHYVLEAMPEILKNFPDTKVYVAGDVITRYGTLMEKIKIGSYGKYCLELMKKYNLAEKVVFLGRLNSEEMCERYLKSHLFLSPSAIENSPNSVGEAMLLGMPVVSSAVGGVANMLTDKEEGLLYPYQDVNKLADAVCTVFADEEQAKAYGERAREHALRTHDPGTNYRRLLEIYRELAD